LKSLHTHFFVTYAIAIFGFNVVNGTGEIFTSCNVAALRKEDLPAFGLPTKPTSIIYRIKKKK
jgi:hypothetical protein